MLGQHHGHFTPLLSIFPAQGTRQVVGGDAGAVRWLFVRRGQFDRARAQSYTIRMSCHLTRAVDHEIATISPAVRGSYTTFRPVRDSHPSPLPPWHPQTRSLPRSRLRILGVPQAGAGQAVARSLCVWMPCASPSGRGAPGKRAVKVSAHGGDAQQGQREFLAVAMPLQDLEKGGEGMSYTPYLFRAIRPDEEESGCVLSSCQ